MMKTTHNYLVWAIVAASAVAIATPAAIRFPADRASARLAASERAVRDANIEFYERRLERDPRNFIVGGRLADAYFARFQAEARLYDIERAEQVARAMIPASLSLASAHARLAFVLLAQHAFGEALAAAESAVAADSASDAALAATFDAAFAAGRYDRARQALERMDDGELATELRQVRWYAATGELDAAHHIMKSVCRRFAGQARRRETVAWCFTRLADLAHQRDGVDAARRWLHRALAADPTSRGALESLADLAYARGDWRQARRLYARIATAAHPDLYLRLAEVAEALGAYETARRHESEFLRLAADPEREPLFAHSLAVYYAGKPGRRDDALRVIQRDIARRPSAESYEILGWVRLLRGELEKALAAAEKAAAFGGASPTVDYIAGSALKGLGRTEEARSRLENATADPTLLEHFALSDLRTPSLEPIVVTAES